MIEFAVLAFVSLLCGVGCVLLLLWAVGLSGANVEPRRLLRCCRTVVCLMYELFMDRYLYYCRLWMVIAMCIYVYIWGLWGGQVGELR